MDIFLLSSDADDESDDAETKRRKSRADFNFVIRLTYEKWIELKNKFRKEKDGTVHRDENDTEPSFHDTMSTHFNKHNKSCVPAFSKTIFRDDDHAKIRARNLNHLSLYLYCKVCKARFNMTLRGIPKKDSDVRISVK